MNIFEHMFSFLWGKCLGMELLGQFFRYILNIVRKCRTLFPIFYNFMLFLSCASAEHPGSWKECRLWNYVLSCPCVLTQSCLTVFTQWTVACHAPLSMGFSGRNTGVSCHFVLQGIFPTQRSNSHPLQLLISRKILYH